MMGAHGKPGLLSDPRLLEQIPPELVDILTQDPNTAPDALSLAALQPAATNQVFAHFEPVFTNIAARWLSSDHQICAVEILSAFSRILPFAPYIRCFVQIHLEKRKESIPLFSGSDPSILQQISDEKLYYLLLSLFRLLSFDLHGFSSGISPVQLRQLFSHPSGPIRYLSIRCFGLYMRVADAAMEEIIAKHHGDDPITGDWEGKSINYRYLSLWEERRWKALQIELKSSRSSRSDSAFSPWLKQLHNSDYVSNVGGILVPTPRRRNSTQSPLVKTPTSIENLRNVGCGLLTVDPILLIGPAGSGKTSIALEAARELGHESTMVTLHLNEQTDSKGLLGVYSTSRENGGFAWQPGVLTQAAKEGRWVLIEDLDRAPSEVLGLILPLVENRELVIPSRKEHIRCAEGFRVLATMRSSLNSRGEEVAQDRSMLGSRLWRRTRVIPLPMGEVKEVIREKFPLLSVTRFLDRFLRLFSRMESVLHGPTSRKRTQGRYLGLRDLIKFCQRAERRLALAGVDAGKETIPDRTEDDIFLDAVDCFATYLPVEALRSALVGVIAEELSISPQRAHFCLLDRVPTYTDETTTVTIGRECCPKITAASGIKSRLQTDKQSTFAPTKITLRTMEQVAAALQVSEPLLLVGETGIGKTAVVQQLAKLLRQRLTVVNMSQQSETTDLLGGYKPVNLRSTAITLVDEFTALFESTFSTRKNQKFLTSVSKTVASNNWPRLINILKEAMKMASTVFGKRDNDDESLNGTEPEQRSKKRKLNSSKYTVLRSRWESFTEEVTDFEQRLSLGDSKFSFAFVPGKIVKALKNGEWVLLDEINLASPDTLESIAGLLHDARDGGPSVLLSEAGDVDRVHAHPNFRIFGAMNPATDSGKRDLVPGLRSRFTEVYVQSPDGAIDDLLNLIEAYLGPLVAHDKAASSSLASLYVETKRLTTENKLVDGAGQKPHFSVRTLVRTLVYTTDQAHVYGLRRAMYEGFSMSFLTLLSKESERQIIPLLDKHIFGNLRNSRSTLSQTPREPSDGGAYVQFKHYWMQRGNSVPEPQPHYILTPFIERNLMNLVRASSTRRFPILLQGPTSSGKTSMVEYLSKISGNRFVRINNHEHTDLQEYLGTYISGEDGTLRYQEGVLVEALRNGHWIVLDELNLAPTDVLEALNRLLDDNRELFLPETQEVVRPHPNFMLFATQNPAGLYGGRKILSRAFRNRFLELHFDDIPEDELEFILKERSQVAPSFCTRIVSIYRQLAVLRQSSRLFEQKNSFATLRDLFRWANRRADNREQLAINGFMLLAERVRNAQEREAVKHVIEKVMGMKLDERSIYSSQNLQIRLERLNAASPTGIVWTHAMRRLFILVCEALEHNEPVLLVGETGCGKTQLSQAVAEAYGKALLTVNAHVNLETGDLVGAQRPLRNRAAIEHQLFEDISSVLQGSRIPDVPQDLSLDDAKLAFNSLQAEQLENLDKTLMERIRINVARSKALFEWSDGSLVTAMKSGDHFLLDELSLADDSVLERLNSVLEPQRSILLAEKGPVDSAVVAKDGFQFLSTMNPGGDYGKRELSAALRNRLTEIWVPPLSEAEDILPILESKLERSLPGAPKAMVEYARWFNARPGGASSTMISIRDLLAWVGFVNCSQDLDTASALVHGASMVYIDSLGANPSAMLAGGSENLDQTRATCLDKLGELLSVNALSIYSQPTNLSIDSKSLTIGPFHLTVGANPRQEPTFALDAPTTLANTLRIARGLQSNKPILLEGSPGVGKTTLVATLAGVLGKPLTRINLSEQTDLTDLFGSDVPVEGDEIGTFAWSDAPFLRAMQHGGWVLLDEMNLASQSVLEGLNSCLDHRQQVYITELDQTFQRHPDFILFAAQNPHHQGGGRKGLPASFVNRFSVVYADSFTPHDLRLICRKISPGAASIEIERLVQFLSSLNVELSSRRLGAIGGPWELNLRDLSRWFKLLESAPGASPWQYLDIAVSNRFRTREDRLLVSDIYATIFGEIPRAKSYFHNLASDVYQVGLAVLTRGSVVQNFPDTYNSVGSRDLPVMESLILCIEKAWPAILVGSSGCGKTTTLRKLASFAGSNLVELALNSDTDAMDLVGGFEQRDIQRQLSSFVDDLSSFLRHHIISGCGAPQHQNYSECLSLYQDLNSGNTHFELLLGSLRSIYRSLPSETLRGLYERCLSLARISREANKVGFEWTDGVLIHAIEKGDWVVLDNANLCSASVLDRLNSLMEPDGYLIINEQKTSDGEARMVKPHSNFRLFLTMDPRYGELSRAMRNRAVEICLMPNPDVVTSEDSPITYTCESSIYRLRQLQHIGWKQIPTEYQSEVLATAIDHLSAFDVTHATDLASKISHDEPSEDTTFLQSSPLKLYKSLIEDGTLRGSIDEELSGTLIADGHNLKHRQAIEPLHPLVNELRLLRISTERIHHQLVPVARLQELQLQNSELLHDLVVVEKEARMKRVSEMSHLELSIFSNTLPPHLKSSSHPFAPFLSRCNEEMTNLVRRADVASLQSGQPAVLNEVMEFCRDILRLSQSKTFEDAEFQAYLQIGRSIYSRYKASGLELVRVLSKSLDGFQAGWSLTTGHSMQRMWNKWRPATAPNHDGRVLLSKLRHICAQFDRTVLQTSLAPSQMNVLRNSLIEAQRSILLGADASSLVVDLEAQINNAEFHAQTTKPISTPHFSAEFEALCQFHDLTTPGVPSHPDVLEILGVMQLFAGRPSSPDDISSLGSSLPDLLSRVSHFSGLRNRNSRDLAAKGDVCLTLLHKLSSTEDVPLSQIDLLASELRLISKGLALTTNEISMDQTTLVRHAALSILKELLICHGDLFEGGSLQSAVLYLEHPNDKQAPPIPIPAAHSSEDAEPAVKLLLDTFQRSLESPIAPKEQSGGEQVFKTGEMFILLSLTCLQLFVPNRLFDPSLNLAVEKQRYARRYSRIKRKLEGLKFFEAGFSGQSENLRITLAEDDLAHLGAEPPQTPVTRPEISQLHSLQGEFQNILSSVLNKNADDIISSSQVLGDSDNNETGDVYHISILQRNIRQLCVRLTAGYEAYEDITTLVVRFLQLLDLGVTFIQRSRVSSNGYRDLINGVNDEVPFLGTTEATLYRLGHNDFSPHMAGVELTLHRLSVLNCAQNTDPDTLSHPAYLGNMRKLITNLHRLWKSQLEQDQTLEMEKSRMYTYRGSGEDHADAEAEEMSQLFPNFESDTQARLPDTCAVDPKKLSLSFSQFLNSFFTAGDKEARLQKTILDSTDLIGKLTSNPEQLASVTLPKSYLSAVLLSLDNQGRDRSPKLYNFYGDPVLDEAKRLVQLVEKVLQRFASIQKSWPEHATLADVIGCCLQIFKFKQSEPLAKLITKTEQLHAFVYEWQAVASREFSAAECYTELTALIIDWRKLELSTWSRLLDIEDEKCDNDAAGWSFVAYDAAIAIPLQMVEEGREGSIQEHTPDLTTTLEKFIHSTAMGQFPSRLRLIKQLKSILDIFASGSRSLNLVSSALGNLIRHYEPFVPIVTNMLRQDRQSLEKDIKQEVQLASWKDTNITALRESSRRSHNKLFKTVRKYRELLSRDCQALLEKGYPHQPYQQEQTDPPSLSMPDPTSPDTMAICRDSPVWETKPGRFKDPNNSVKNMRHLYQSSLVDFNAGAEVDAFIRDILETITSFRSKTPKTSTTENGEEIQHLKTQKRRYYAEKLKDLRHMGIQSNLSTNILHNQTSISSVLANTPCIPMLQGFPQVATADTYFHRFLDLVPRVRIAGRNYSEDLSNVEAGRSAGFVEGMLFRVLKQRMALNISLEMFTSLETAVGFIGNLCSSHNIEPRPSLSTESTKRNLQATLRWFGTTMGICARVIEIRQMFASVGSTNVLDHLKGFKTQCDHILSLLDGLPAFPPGISSTTHDQYAIQAQTFVKNARSQILDWIQAYPEIAFALEQLLPWAALNTNQDSLTLDTKSPTQALENVDSCLLATMDKVFVSLQRLNSSLSSAPSSADDQAWLTKSDQTLSRSINSLGIKEISASLSSALEQLAQIPKENHNHFRLGVSTAGMVLPIIQQYHSICFDILQRHSFLHREVCKMSYLLASSFSQIASDGFCSPAEASDGQGKSDKLESGTGLGEGEGAEDISKDVQDDEDLSELAQQKDEQKDRKDEMEGTSDAVNMDQQDLEADASDVEEESKDEPDKESDAEGDDEDLDEEVGSVDGLDDSAVDEKLWDGANEEQQKDTENYEGKGQSMDDKATTSEEKAEETEKDKENEGQRDEEPQEEPDDEEEGVGREEADVTDPHTKEDQILDLPEDMELDGQGKVDESDEGDDTDDLSMGDDKAEDQSEEKSEENEEYPSEPMADDTEVDDGEREGTEETGVFPDGENNDADIPDEAEDEKEGDKQESGASDSMEAENVAPSDTIETGMGQESKEEKGASGDATQDQPSVEQTDQSNENGRAAAPEGEESKQGGNEAGGSGDEGIQDSETQAFKKLGDILEEWHRRQHQIKEASQHEETDGTDRDVSMEDAEFEHLANDEDVADTQALGQADEGQVQGMDQTRGVESEAANKDHDVISPTEDIDDSGQQRTLEDQMEIDQPTPAQNRDEHSSSFIANSSREQPIPSGDHGTFSDVEDIDNVDNDMSAVHLSADSAPLTSPDEARRLWSHYESATHDLSLSLTEQLRLILAPTMATKLRGDFRTGKRLNIKRIIPYIASQYKRDKIWMRRSVPSKRNYQIMLAVDDSKSMLESGSGQLAFETLALVSKSLSMLEAGDLCIVGFGNEDHIRVAHEFGKPFSSEAGMRVFQQFSYKQTGTNVRKLVADAIALFREARTKQSSSSMKEDLWQLQLIISDGICEDHDVIRRLVRQAQEERIMIVFIVVDAVADESRSIMNLTQASFEPGESGVEGGKWKMRRYLDEFPFPYYLVVRDVQELPAVLSLALKQWFAEVVETSS